MRQPRDSTRLTDLNSINKALALFDVTNPDDFTGTSTIIYTSLPDTSSTCSGLTPPSGYLYHCVTSSTLTKIDGTGWIPANLSNISYGSPIGKLPLDPENSSTTGRFYTYIMGGSWELNALLESNKYRYDESVSKTNLPGVLSVGSNKNLSPVYNNNDLIAYYKFNEGSGTVLNDVAGNSYTGTITAGNGGWAANQNNISGRAYDFDGTTTIVNTGSEWIGTTASITISAWVYADSYGGASQGKILSSSNGATGIWLSLDNSAGDNRIYFSSNGATNIARSLTQVFSTGRWHHVLVTRNGSTAAIYLNGTNVTIASNSGDPVTGTVNLTIGGQTDGGRAFDGRISDVRIYNRVLSAAEILTIYNATR